MIVRKQKIGVHRYRYTGRIHRGGLGTHGWIRLKIEITVESIKPSMRAVVVLAGDSAEGRNQKILCAQA